jgi:hypothetical protein
VNNLFLRKRTIGLAALLVAAASPVLAQKTAPDSGAEAVNAAPVGRHWPRMALGFATSILAHETGHFVSAVALGAKPYVGFDNGRPTVYSGLYVDTQAHKQLIFATSGLAVQAVIDELILDLPHSRGSAFERGILTGGIATSLFYATLGRNGEVSDIAMMSRTSSLSKTQASMIFVGISALHALRISRNEYYANFFYRPTSSGNMQIGVQIQAERR